MSYPGAGYPGAGPRHYNGQLPPQPPPLGGYNSHTGQYQPPPGPPPGHPSNGGSFNGYGPPAGPPPTNGTRGAGGPNQNAPPPSSAPQSFGVQGMTYQYSNCQGRRKALCIGINYFNSSNELRGCINDARAVSNMLQRQYGYSEDDIVMLTDDQQNPRSIPTRANIISAMHWLVNGAQTNDSLFLHYSGHGGQTEDLDGDEDDGYDEVIYPVDFEQAGHIVDDEIHDIVVKPLMPGVRLTALFDSCHSGTILDLPYLYSTKGVLKEPNLAKDAGMGLLTAFGSYERGDLFGAVGAVTGVAKRVMKGNSGNERAKQLKTSPADVILFSGCKDSQTSADTQSAGVNTGAVSYAFMDVVARNPNQTYISLLNEMRNSMMGKYSQKPQLSCCHPLDVNLRFIL